MRSGNHAALPHFFRGPPGPEARFETDGEKSAQLACRLRIGIHILEQFPHWKCFEPMVEPSSCNGLRAGDRFRRVRKADTPQLARCTAPRSSASLAGQPRRPFSRHQRKRSELRVGTMMPGPAKASAEAINA